MMQIIIVSLLLIAVGALIYNTNFKGKGNQKWVKKERIFLITIKITVI